MISRLPFGDIGGIVQSRSPVPGLVQHLLEAHDVRFRQRAKRRPQGVVERLAVQSRIGPPIDVEMSQVDR